MSNADLWYVKLADGDVHRVNLDQLDDAFQAGHIDAKTMVLAAGSTQWTTLGQLLGLDEDEGVASATDDDAAGVAHDDAASSSHEDVLESLMNDHSVSDVDDDPPIQLLAPSGAVPITSRGPSTERAPLARTGGPAAGFSPGASYVPQPATYVPQIAPYVPQQSGNRTATHQAVALAGAQATARTVQPEASYIPQVPAVERPARAPLAAVAPWAPPAMAPAPGAPLATSVRPVSVDLGDYGADADADALRPRRRGKRLAAAFVTLSAVAAVAAVAVTRPPWARPVLSRVGLSTPTVAVAAPPPGTVDAPPPPVAEPPAPPQQAASPIAAAPPPAGDSPLSPHFTDRSTPDAKGKVAEADKPKPAGKHGKGAAPHPGAKSKSTIFTTGGSKYDPLNSSI